jgi:hypothetical protein
MSSKEVAQKQSGEVAQKQSSGVGQAASDTVKTVTETASSAGASLTGAFSGSLSAGAHSSNKKTTTTSSSGSQISKKEADQLYEERIEDEYAKREGGA